MRFGFTEGLMPAGKPEPVARVDVLEEPLSPQEQKAESPAPAEEAIAVLLAVGSRSSAEAWDMLREISMHTSIKLRHVAELIVDWGITGRLPTEIRKELERRLARRHQESADAGGR